MTDTKGFLLAVAAAAMAFTFSCSGDDGGGGGDSSSSDGGLGEVSSSSGGGQDGGGNSFRYCLISGQCLDGPFTSKECGDFGGLPSNSCTGGVSSSSKATPSSSSSSKATPSSVTYGGETYQTVVIGTQTWFAKNLNYNASGSKCYNNLGSNCDIYGRLYNWSAAKAACPSGWHLPTKAEWEVMTAYIGGEKTEGKVLKATSGWSGGGNGTNLYGFSALPGGFGLSGGSFDGAGYEGGWWSASEYISDIAYSRLMDYYRENARWNNYDKSYLFSVRCLQDRWR